MSNILSKQPELFCTHEALPQLVGQTAVCQYGEISHDELAEILRETRPAAIDGRRYDEPASRLSPTLAYTCPAAQSIWVTRDGQNFVSSGVQHSWYTDAAKALLEDATRSMRRHQKAG